MLNSLIGNDIEMMRKRYDEALELQGIDCTYQYPHLPGSNTQGETLVDSFSDPIETRIFFEGNPKVKTIKRYGWVVENSDELPFIIHCSWNLEHVQRDSLFRFSGQYADIPDRVFKATAISYDLQAPDHLAIQVVPVYDEEHITGRTESEVRNTFNSSNHFIKPRTDYRGDTYVTKEDVSM